MSCHHIMIDLETEGTRAGCVIRQIGAASFNPFTGEVDRTFEMNLDVEEQRSRFGLVSDPKTLVWLQALPANVQEAMTRDPKPVGEVIMALIRAFDWSHPETRLWCHGATFDEPILRELIIRFGIEVGLKDLVPWGYLKARCTRDRLELAGVKVERDAAKAHTGLEDCIKQIKALSEATRIIEGWKDFKAYVHLRLDRAGIPVYPNGPHTAQGCRIGDRLDLALAGLPYGPVSPHEWNKYTALTDSTLKDAAAQEKWESEAFASNWAKEVVLSEEPLTVLDEKAIR